MRIWRFLIFVLFFALPVATRAQTVISATSCSQSAVSAALAAATGSIVIVKIPSGTCIWTGRVTYNMSSAVTDLTIEGSTVVNCSGIAGTASYACTATDNTVLIDAVPGSNQTMLSIGVGGSSSSFRLTGVTFQGGNLASGNNKSDGFIDFGGGSQHFRVDHNHFNTRTYAVNDFGGGLTTYSKLAGVIDHNRVDMDYQENAFRFYGGGDAYGDTSWSQPTTLGSGALLFVETNDFHGGFVNDCNIGARMVIRYNSIRPIANQGDSGGWQGHQIGQGTQRYRSCRQLEGYHNYSSNPAPSATQFAAGGGPGVGVAFGNTMVGYDFDIVFEYIRELATGHAQTNTPNGIGYCGSPSNGTASGWDGNQTTATGYPCLDSVGRGQGDLVNGRDFPNMLNTFTGTISWPRQKREPWYVWMETGASTGDNPWNGLAPLRNRDYYTENAGQAAQTSPTSPFDGSTTIGMGHGTLAFRPTTCTAGPGGIYGASPTGSYGVGYFATDANSGRGELYVCTSANTWTGIYEPYIYPHPLVGGSGSSPLAPSGLSVIVQ